MDELARAFAQLHAWVFEHAVQPALFTLGLTSYAELAFDAVEVMLVGLIEIALLYAVLRPLEALRPAERLGKRVAVQADVIYTFLHRLGFLPLAIFFVLLPLQKLVEGPLRFHGIIPKNLEDWIAPLAAYPLATFLVYLVVLDFADYWRHRLQHRFNWWWALHSLHHSQRQLTFWADDRNHLLDDLIKALWFAGIALLIGVPPEQFVLIVALQQGVESLSHANIRAGFGKLAGQMLVSPRYHRAHHGIGIGHEGVYRGCNFATLFPLWDILFATAELNPALAPTGIRDQLQGRDYGDGLWRQQWLGLLRLSRALLPRQIAQL
jgi:sterol desaturase/sphingolipid hydroxylase (fatty acid hydroxylase superfamily)